ncbi:aldehyde dehydrogenase family protein [Demetria terragena]|uniref:aldehyde dehydrogenase family protein n=1 Tax=Demetria terragena TaxID=63959 RepID=UPI000370EF3B|nr:aldehyde dehydrogenase family protein [Demetria terragena]
MTTTSIETDNAKRAEQIVQRAKAGEQAWGAVGVAQRREMLERFSALVEAKATEWVEIATRIKGLDPDSSIVGEEWTSGPYACIQYAQQLIPTLRRMEEGKGATDGFTIVPQPGDRVAVEVLPHTVWDHLLQSGFSAQVWIKPGVTEAQVRSRAGLGMKKPAQTNGTCLVLGAGNIFSIAPLDALYVLYADNRSVALKLNPITDDLLPILEAIFAPFIEIGAVQVFSSDIELGSLLTQHDGIDAVHMTGSEATHDVIVWGPGDQGAANKAADTPQLTKPMTSELGGVSPAIVVPGEWSSRDIEFQANHVATQRLHNAGSNCVAAQMVIISSDWAQKDQFLKALRRAMAKAPKRPSWYPGSADRVAAVREENPENAVPVGGTPERTLLSGLDLSDDSETAFETEFFAPVLGVSELPGLGADFLATAIDTSNERLRGTLGANIVIHPKTEEQIGEKTMSDLIASMRYGTVAINCWTGVGYLTATATWGAFPGHALNDIQSGHGVVHNAVLLADVERTVIRGPFRPYPRSVLAGEMSLTPKPPWFVNNKTAASTGEKLVRFAAQPGWGRLPAVFASALRG